MMTVAELEVMTNRLHSLLANRLPFKVKVKYDPIDRFWVARYDDGEYDVQECYRYTANRGFMRFSIIKRKSEQCTYMS